MNPIHPSPQQKPHPALSARQLDATEVLIEQALNAMRDAKPEAGMEARLLAALEHRGASQPGSLLARFFSRLRTPQLALGAGVAVVIALLVLVPLRIQRRSIASASAPFARTTTTEETVAGNARPFFRASTANRKVASSTTPPARSPRYASEPSLQDAASHLGSASLASASSTDNPDALALAELRAPSQPAPPLPLTSQERILLGVAHHPQQFEITALDPVERASLTDRELADFHHFFYKPLLPQPTISPVVPGETNAP